MKTDIERRAIWCRIPPLRTGRLHLITTFALDAIPVWIFARVRQCLSAFKFRSRPPSHCNFAIEAKKCQMEIRMRRDVTSHHWERITGDWLLTYAGSVWMTTRPSSGNSRRSLFSISSAILWTSAIGTSAFTRTWQDR